MFSLVANLWVRTRQILADTKAYLTPASKGKLDLQRVGDATPYVVPYDENLLEQSRLQWQLGDWDSLTLISRETLQHHPDRAKLALFVAAGHFQCDNIDLAKQFVSAAMDWGCSKKILSQVLISGVYRSLGRAAMVNNDKSNALKYFKNAAAVSNQHVNCSLLAETQVEREILHLKQLKKLPLSALSTTQIPRLPNIGIVSYAQNFEDVLLWRALGTLEKGFYIDIGAQDPNFDSVSKAFYEHGWRGIHVEPLPEYVQALRRERPDEEVIDTILSDEVGYHSYYQVPKTGMSTGIREIAEKNKQNGWGFEEVGLVSTTLAKVFDKAGSREIHWLKVDVEGMEDAVLRGWHNHPARPWIVVVEATAPNSQTATWEDWEHNLIKRDYVFVYFDGLNRYYVHTSHRELASLLAMPPNVFDGFLLAKHCNHKGPLAPAALSWRINPE